MVPTGRNLHKRASGPRLALILAVLPGLLAGCDQAPVEDEPTVRPVRYTRVVAQGDTMARTYSGTARAELETDLSFRVGGTLTQLPVNVGSVVSRGETVAVLDDTDYRVRLDEARAGLARAEAERRNADANYARTRDLYENQDVSRNQLDSARALAESAQAQYRAASQQVEAARLQLSYTRLTAPQDCTVAQEFVELNQNVSPGQPVIGLNCGNCAEVVVSVSDADIARVTEGMAVSADVSAVPGGKLPGVVREVGVAAAARGTTYPVTIGLQESCENIRSGMAVDVTFEFPTAASGSNLAVPYVAVGEDRDGNFVFVLEAEPDGRLFARRRAVQVGEASADGIIIVQGLSEGELIATAGVRRLVAGQEVTLLGEAEAPRR